MSRSWVEYKLFFKSLFWLCYFRCVLRSWSFKGLIDFSESRAARSLATSSSSVTVSSVIWALSRAGDLVPGATCLVRALAGRIVFASQGYVTELEIGVCKSSNIGIDSHAWLMLDGKPVLGNRDNLDKYTSFLMSR